MNVFVKLVMITLVAAAILGNPVESQESSTTMAPGDQHKIVTERLTKEDGAFTVKGTEQELPNDAAIEEPNMGYDPVVDYIKYTVLKGKLTPGK